MCQWLHFWIMGCISGLAILHLSVAMPVNGIINAFSGIDMKINNTDTLLQHLEREIAASNTPSCVTKLRHLKNVTTGQEQLARKVFSELMSAIGWSRLENVLPMYWTKIMNFERPFSDDTDRYTKCSEIFHPDHFMSNIILENLVRRRDALQKQFYSIISKIFCNKRMNKISLHFVQSDDVISGIVVISVQNDGTIFSLANVGF